MKKSLQLLDEILVKAEHDNRVECSIEGALFESFYVFHLKNLKKLIIEEGSENFPFTKEEEEEIKISIRQAMGGDPSDEKVQ